MQELENRIAALEQLIGEGDHIITETIYNQIQQLRDICRQANLSAKITKLSQVIYNYDLNYCYEALPPQSKIQLILSSERILTESSSNLQKILKYKKFVDFEPIIGLQDKINQILLLQTSSILTLKDNEIIVQSSNQTMLSDEFKKYQSQLEALVQVNYELKQYV